VNAAQDSSVDPIFVLIGPDGDAITADDDGGIGDEETLNAAVREFELPENGTYLLVVSHAGGGSYGEVKVKVLP